MLCEALTQAPHSFVFNEPNVASGHFVVRARESEVLLQHGIDLQAFVNRWSRMRRRFLLRGFRTRLIPEIQSSFSQVGIKEIFHANWRKMHAGFPNLRIILTARDPRDIYLSLRGRYLAGTAIWDGEFTPTRVAAALNEEFRYQQEMAGAARVLNVRYEDLCLDPASFRKVLDFVESDITNIGPLGEFLQADSKRVAEGRMHGGEITDQRVARWKNEDDEEVSGQALQVFRQMPEYCNYWQYAE
jgi:Sulfotransferase family